MGKGVVAANARINFQERQLPAPLIHQILNAAHTGVTQVLYEAVTGSVHFRHRGNGNAFHRIATAIRPVCANNFHIKAIQDDTPLGKKIIEVTPMIAQENMRILQGSVQSVGPMIQQRIMSRFQKEGIGAP